MLLSDLVLPRSVFECHLVINIVRLRELGQLEHVHASPSCQLERVHASPS